MKKLINHKNYMLGICILCFVLTFFNIVMVLMTNERLTETTIMLKEDMREILKINRLKDARFRADYPDVETWESYDWNKPGRKVK